MLILFFNNKPYLYLSTPLHIFLTHTILRPFDKKASLKKLNKRKFAGLQRCSEFFLL